VSFPRPHSPLAKIACAAPGEMYNLYLRDGKQVGLMHVTFSKDFKTFTISAKGADAQGKPFELLGFYEKQ
jgi:hypothetical protein